MDEIKQEIISTSDNSAEDITFHSSSFSIQNDEIESFLKEQSKSDIETMNQCEPQVTSPSSIIEFSPKSEYLQINDYNQNELIPCDRTSILQKNIKKISGHFVCSFCMESFQWRHRCENHVRKEHTKELLITCDQCNRRFTTLQCLKEHEARFHNAKTYKCQVKKKSLKKIIFIYLN